MAHSHLLFYAHMGGNLIFAEIPSHMYKSKPGVDVIAKLLDALYAHNPDALFVMSLMHQYEERGSLSKKQLEGLLAKARKVPNIPQNWLGTLEAIMLRMPNRYKTAEPVAASPIYQKEEAVGRLIDSILSKYPQHKRVLFLKTQYDTHKPLSTEEIAELNRFRKILKIGDQ